MKSHSFRQRKKNVAVQKRNTLLVPKAGAGCKDMEGV